MQKNLTLKEIIEKIEKLPPELRRKAKKKLIQLSRKKTLNEIQGDFLTFVKHMWPDFIEGSHHKVIAEKFNKLATGEKLFKQPTPLNWRYVLDVKRNT